MQPDQEKTDWQPPAQQLSQAPYAAVPAAEPSSRTPVVSLAPDETSQSTEQPVSANASMTQNGETPTAQAPLSQPSQPDDQPVRWQAHEYIHHDKSPIWFVLFAVVVIGLMLVAIFVIKSVTFAILIPVMAAALLVYSHRPPRLLTYTLSRQGLHINDHLYSFSQFKGFGVIHDGKEYSVMLIPIKRFQPGVSVYFPEEAGEAIVDMLAVRLPMQELHLDAVDRIVRKLRI